MQPTSTITKGLIIALIMIAVSIGIYFSGMDMNGPVKWLTYCILVIGIIVSIMQYGKQVDYNASFGNYFGHGFKIAATVTVIMIIYIVVFVLLFPEMKEKALDEASKAMSKQDMPDDQKATAMEMIKKSFMLIMIGGTLLWNIILGLIASLIGAAVTKKNPRPLEELNQNMV